MTFYTVRRLRNTVGVTAVSGAAAYYILAAREARVLREMHHADAAPAAAVCWGTRFYKGLIGPVLFPLTASDPEVAHRMAITSGAVYGKLAFFLHRYWNCFDVYRKRVMDRLAAILLDGDTRRPAYAALQGVDPLKQTLFGVEFPRPVGVAAGFDKNGELLHLFTSAVLGNGFAEVGSVSKEPWPGNPRPRLFRLPRDGAVINRMGLNNRGAESLRGKLQSMTALLNGRRHTPPIGVNITKTPSPSIEDDAAVADMLATFDEVAPYAAYINVNISCPNTAEGKTFEDPEALDKLLRALLTWRRDNFPDKAVLVKLSPPPAGADEKYFEGVSAMVRKAVEIGVDGFVMVNTVSDRAEDLGLDRTMGDIHHREKGGISGKPVRQRAINLVRHVYRATEGKVPIIGCGGVFTAEDAYRLIRSGASLIQARLASLGVLALGGTFRNICSGEKLANCVDRVSELLASPLLKESFEYVNETQITCRTFGGVPMVACELLNQLSMRTLTAGYSYVSECLDDGEGSEKECPNFDELRNELATPALRLFEGYGSTPMGVYMNSLRQGFEGYIGALNPDPYRVISDTERMTRDTADHVRHMVWSTNHFLWMHSADMARNLSQDLPFYHFRRDLGMRWDTAIALLEEMAVHRGPNLAVVEIGVFSGHFSDFVLGALPNVTLIGIDPYYGDDGTFPPELAHLDPVMVYEQTKERYSKYSERAKLWATTSKEASRVIPDESVDLIFIDGCHEYDCVREDIDLWLPKLRPGGIMSGHDFSDKWPGVVRRVNEIRAGQDLFLGMDFMWWWMKEANPSTAEVA
ncbi:hypothetical protein FOZ62_013990 [Perkinsus olseni]|uniref:Dihydroorotate dehydrogenase (quinone), mitochondrial n=1 Tax=Perkinsus olseni TaxID=32597 RepID=A0A7J6TYK9_PEROL|nr:hypothetical protein FOZ62_013990 [Perkinsus olseni]